VGTVGEELAWALRNFGTGVVISTYPAPVVGGVRAILEHAGQEKKGLGNGPKKGPRPILRR
jgi:hypothetical protein